MSAHQFTLPANLEDLPPTYTLTHGQLWQFREHDILEEAQIGHVRYMIRALPRVNMLAMGALLRHVSQFEHPRLYSPNFWTQHQGNLWIASLRPLGEPLPHADLQALPWNEAVRLWQPLAEAIQRAHQRGIIHGQLAPWTIWYNREADELTAIDLGTWLGDDLTNEAMHPWIAPEFRVAAFGRHPNTLVDIYGLAKLLLHLLDPYGEQEDPLSIVPPFAQAVVARALSEDPAERLPRVEELISATSPTLLEKYDARLRDASAEEITSVLSARLSDREYFKHPKLGRGLKFHLNLPNNNPHDQDQLGAFFYHSVDSSLYHSVRWAWNGAQINLLDARVVTNSKNQRFITSHAETLPVIEPTFPIAVSNVLKAERCTSRFLVDERDSGSSSRALVLGNLVHGLLDDLTTPNPPTFDEAYHKYVTQLRLDMLAAGMTDDDLDALKRDAKQHYENLCRFTHPAQSNKAVVPDHSPSVRWPQQQSVYQADDQRTWSGRHIEVTRYSPMYGLEGRIDLATEDEKEGLQIIELKSGSAWDGHLSQVRCYTLLWDGLAKQRNLPIHGYVLYSRFGRLSAAPMEDVSRERRILRARNELVACHRAFVDPSYKYTPPHYMQDPRNCNSPTCKFRRDRCKEQTEVLGLQTDHDPEDAVATDGKWRGFEVETVARAWAYWRHFTRLVEMERWAQHASLGAIFQPGRLGQRLNNHRAVTGMNITNIDLEEGTITFEGKGTQIFSPGASILAHRGDLQNAHILQGRVVDASHGHVTVTSQGAQIATTLETKHWIIDILPTRLGVRQAKRALYKTLKQRDANKLATLLTPEHPEVQARFNAPGTFDPTPPDMMADIPLATISNQGPKLNDTQRRALHLAVHAPSGAIIQGPPGTGKTTVIAQIVRELVVRGQRVLVTAQTNTAVDTILQKVLDAGVRSFLRVGGQGRSHDLCKKLTESGADTRFFFTTDVAQQAHTLEDLGNYLKTCSVYGSTTHSAISNSAFSFLSSHLGPEPFDVVIVDEASQLTEPMTLGAINMAKRFILVGDHKQLPPIVQSEQALSAYFDPNLPEPEDDDTHIDILEDIPKRSPTFALDEGLRAIGVAGLDRSLFERLIEHLPHVMLEEQYRMHQDIMAYSNRAYYHGKLRANEEIAHQQLPYNPDALSAMPEHIQSLLAVDHPITFVNVHGVDNGRSNPQEANALIDTLMYLMDEKTFDTQNAPTIGIISPFRAQVQLIRSKIRERNPAWLEWIDVDTVERYQGGERDIILVSLVKTERAGDFLSDARRLNVTLTRARRQLYLFGHKACLSLNPTYRQLIEQPETHILDWQADDDLVGLPEGF